MILKTKLLTKFYSNEINKQLKKVYANIHFLVFVPRAGLEPALPKREHGPQPCASTNSATWA